MDWIRGVGNSRTSVELAKEQIVRDEVPVLIPLPLMLTEDEVNFVLTGVDTFSRHLQAALVAIPVILAIDVDESSETGRNVAFALDSDGERQLLVWHGDKNFDGAIAIASTVFFELVVALAHFYGAADLLESRHGGGPRSSRC